jgi:lipopolysaccharide export system permease protein
VDAKKGEWTHVMLHDARDPRSPLLVLASEGKVNPKGPGAALTVGLTRGEIHRGEASPTDYTVLDFQRADIAVGVEDAISHKNRFRSPREEMTPPELLKAAGEAKAQHQPFVPLLVAYHVRIAQAFVPIAFALVGGPLAMGAQRRGRGRSYLFTIGAYVAYYVLSRMFETWGGQGRLSPGTAAQLANLLFACAGVWLLWRRTGRLA